MRFVKIKGILGALAAAGLLSAAFMTYQYGYAQGVAKERDVQAQAVLRWQVKASDALAKLEKAEQARQEVVQETIEVIRYVEDPSGCADADIPDGIYDRLH